MLGLNGRSRQWQVAPSTEYSNMSWLYYLFMVSLLVTAIILIVLVLIQRGKGGGLIGALGGMGGQSAFGAKAGDVFTRVTIGVAFFWIVLCMCALKFMKPAQYLGTDEPSAPISGSADTDGQSGQEAP